MKQQTFIFKKQREKNKPVDETVERSAPKIYTVTEIVSLARKNIESIFPDVLVGGEVSGFKRSSSGHCYFDLKDANSILPITLFKSAANKVKFKIENGLEITCHGRFSLYQRGGKYQLIADHLEPKGIGELQLAFEQLKKKLREEGLFDKERKRPLPFLPKKIGVVTSSTGAAVRDILNILKRRYPAVDVIIAPCRVQGTGSAEEIADGIYELNQLNDIDLLIVGRGGGSLEDLWAFNEEIVARAIYNSQIPVVSAVGHEVDFTIADFVADYRAPTPSAAAECAVPVVEELMLNIRRLRRQLRIDLVRLVEKGMEKLTDLKERLVPPSRNFPEFRRYIDSLTERMIYILRIIVNKKESDFKGLVAELNHLSPLSILSKGYSVVTTSEGTAIKKSNQLRVNQSVCLKFHQGRSEAKITKIVD